MKRLCGRFVGPAIVVAMAAACSSPTSATSGTGTPPPSRQATASPAATPTARGLDPHVVAVIEVGTAPTGIAYGFGRVWVSNHHSNSVSIIDPASNVVTQEIPFEAQPHGITIGDGYVWVATTKADGTIVRIDPKTLELTEFVPGESDIACAPEVAYHYVYVSQPGFDPGVAFISKSSEATHKLVAKIQVGDGFTCGIVGAEGSIWAAVTDGSKHELWQIEKSTARVERKIPLDCGSTMWPQSYAFGSLWTAPMPEDDGWACRVDPKTGSVIARIDVGVGGVLAATSDGVWIADGSGGGLVRINPETNEVDLRIDLPTSEGHMWSDGSDIWFSSFNTNEVWRIRP
jgi:YVTN family beta-propeller protein